MTVSMSAILSLVFLWLVTAHCTYQPDMFNSCSARKVGYSPYVYDCGAPYMDENDDAVPCGEGHCVCQGNTSQCTFQNNQTPFIPRLPVHTTVLILEASKSKSWSTGRDFFQNATNITSLRLNFQPGVIDKDAFRHFTNLTALWWNRDYLVRYGDYLSVYDVFGPISSVKTLKLLDLSYNDLGALPDDLFVKYSMPHLETLCLNWIKMTSSLNMTVFLPLTSLSILQLGVNHLNDTSFIKVKLAQIKGLYLRFNNFMSFFSGRDEYDSLERLFPNLTDLDLSRNAAMSLPLPGFVSPRLRTLCLQYVSNITISDHGINNSFPSLSYLFLDGADRTKFSQNAFASTTIQYISLTAGYFFRYGKIDFASSDAHPDMFAGCPNLREIDVSDNDFSRVYYDKFNVLFSQVPNLQTLHLSNSRLTSVRSYMFTNMTRLTSLWLDSNELIEVSAKAFGGLTNLETLSLKSNQMYFASDSVSADMFAGCANLREIDVSENDFSRVSDDKFNRLFSQVPNLQTLKLSKTRLSRISPVMFTNMPRLVSLSLDYNEVIELPHGVFDALTNLTLLNVTNNRIKMITKTTFGPVIRHSLKHMDFSSNEFLCTCQLNWFARWLRDHPAVFHRPESYDCHNVPEITVQSFYVDERICKFTCEVPLADIDNSLANGGSELREIDMVGHDLSNVSDAYLNHLFTEVHNLTTIKLSKARLPHISAAMFANLQHLTVLLLDDTELADIPDGVFDELGRLEVLDLSMNRLTEIRKSTFSEATRARLKHFDLSGNPFLCSCELRWFRQWLTTQPALFNASRKNYMCENIPSEKVQSFFVADQACLWSPGVSKYIIATVVILLLVFFLVTFLYRYRWHIRLLLYEAYRGRGDRWRRLQERHFRYDVFVSYDKEDLNWVREHLMPELEGRLGLRLCIHQRDFILGNPIADNIMESVEDSKKVMMLFSNKFVDSEWCQFELQLCLRHVMENDDILLVVLLEDIPSRDLTPAMMAVMKSMTYIEWEDEAEAKTSFWGRIRLALNEILPAYNEKETDL